MKAGFGAGEAIQYGLRAIIAAISLRPHRVGDGHVSAAGQILGCLDHRHRLDRSRAVPLRQIGIGSAAQRILALKSSVHFRADFQPLASEVLVVAAPGPNPADHTLFRYRRLRPGVHLMPRKRVGP